MRSFHTLLLAYKQKTNSRKPRGLPHVTQQYRHHSEDCGRLKHCCSGSWWGSRLKPLLGSHCSQLMDGIRLLGCEKQEVCRHLNCLTWTHVTFSLLLLENGIRKLWGLLTLRSLKTLRLKALIFLFYILCVYMLACICVCVNYVHAWCQQRSEQRFPVSPRTGNYRGLWAAMWVQGTEPGSSGRTPSTLNYWAIHLSSCTPTHWVQLFFLNLNFTESWATLCYAILSRETAHQCIRLLSGVPPKRLLGRAHIYVILTRQQSSTMAFSLTPVLFCETGFPCVMPWLSWNSLLDQAGLKFRAPPASQMLENDTRPGLSLICI